MLTPLCVSLIAHALNDGNNAQQHLQKLVSNRELCGNKVPLKIDIDCQLKFPFMLTLL